MPVPPKHAPGRHGWRTRAWASFVALAALAAFAAPPARAELTVPGWRVPYEGAEVLASDPGRFQSEVAVRSTEAGLAGLDQFVPAPDGPVTVRVDGGAQPDASVVLEWIDERGRELGRRTVALPTDGRPVEARGGSVSGARTIRVLAALDRPGTLLIDRVELRDAAGAQLLANPELMLAGCPPVQHLDLPPYGPVGLDGWRPRYEGMAVSVAPTASRLELDPPLRISSETGFAGIDQAMTAPVDAFTVTVRGAPTQGRARLMMIWARRPAPYGSFVQIHERQVPLHLRDGVQTETFRALGSGPDWQLVVAVVQLATGVPLDLQSVELFTHGRQRLVNPQLLPSGCPPPTPKPRAVNVLPPLTRWALTLVLAALVGLAGWALHSLLVRRREPAPRPLHPRMEKVLLVAVALLPFVDVGTVKVGVRLIAPDILFGFAGAVLVVAHLRRRRWPFDPPAAVAVAAAALLGLVSVASLALGLSFYSDRNLDGLSTGTTIVEAIGSPQERGVTDLVRLFQGLAALYAMLCLLRTREAWLRVARVVAITAIGLCAFAAYQVIGRVLLGDDLPLPPSSFPYPGLLRATGTFPEPNPLAGYLAFCAACSALLCTVRPSRLAWAGLAAAVVGILLTRSSSGFVALALLSLALLAAGRWRLVASAVAVIAATALVAIGAGAGEEVRGVVDKPFQQTNSRLDREATWLGGLRMGAAYAPVGVGRGQFAYNFAPFVAPEDVWRGGRAQSAAVEIWAESGPLGLLLVLAMAAIGPVMAMRALRRGRGSAATRVSMAFFATLGVVLLTYYTTNYAWIWVAAALAATAHRLHPAPDAGPIRA